MESIAKSPDEIKVLDLCAPVLLEHGFALVDLDCRIGSKSLVRLFVESIEPAKTVSLDDCVRATKAVEPVLEAHPDIPGFFDLEVSSPGLDRRLRTRVDFEQALGYRVKLKLAESIPGFGSKPAGQLKNVDQHGVLLEVDKRDISILWTNIRQANRVWPGPEGDSVAGHN